MPDPNFGAIRVAPKPEFMACAAMTRVLEGTKTIGPLTGLPADCYGYAFDRAGKTVVAVWKAHPGASKISLPLAKGTSAQLIDFMGNPAAIESKGGRVTVAATEYPGYIEGVDASKLTIKVR